METEELRNRIRIEKKGRITKDGVDYIAYFLVVHTFNITELKEDNYPDYYPFAVNETTKEFFFLNRIEVINTTLFAFIWDGFDNELFRIDELTPTRRINIKKIVEEIGVKKMLIDIFNNEERNTIDEVIKNEKGIYMNLLYVNYTHNFGGLNNRDRNIKNTQKINDYFRSIIINEKVNKIKDRIKDKKID